MGGPSGGVPPSKPPKYSEFYETGSTSNGSNLVTPPRYTSKPSSSAEASQENVAKSSAAIPPPPKPKIIKPKKNRKPAPTPPTPSSNASAEPTQSAEQKADSNV